MQIFRNDALPQVEIKVSEGYDEFACRLHSHREYSLGIIHKGLTRNNIPGRTFTLKENDTILFPPELVHLCNPDRDLPYSFTMIYMEQHWFEAAFLDSSSGSDVLRGHIMGSQRKTLKRLVDSLPESDTDMQSWEEEFIQCIGELLLQEEASLPPSSAPGTDAMDALVEDLRQELEDLSSPRRSLEDVAARAGLSRFSLIRRFRKAYGLPPHAYLQNRRIRYCLDALKQGEEMSRIALDAGFTDQSHMIKVFRLYTGMTPGEYAAL